MAIQLDPEDITAIVNRGEVYLTIAFNPSLYLKAKSDFDHAINLDGGKGDPWARRATLLKTQVEKHLRGYKKEYLEKFLNNSKNKTEG